MRKSEMVNAYVQEMAGDPYMQYFVSFIYKETAYKYSVESKVSLKDKTSVRLLITNKNPEHFMVFNFMGFWFIALVIACLAVLAWLLYVQVFFEKVVSFKLMIGKEKKNETDE